MKIMGLYRVRNLRSLMIAWASHTSWLYGFRSFNTARIVGEILNGNSVSHFCDDIERGMRNCTCNLPTIPYTIIISYTAPKKFVFTYIGGAA